MSRAPKVCAIRKPCSISACDCSFAGWHRAGPRARSSGPSSWSAQSPENPHARVRQPTADSKTIVAERAIADAGKKLAARRSGRSERSEGRRIPPASTSSVTLVSRSKERPVGGSAKATPGMRHAAYDLWFGLSVEGEHKDISSGLHDNFQSDAAAGPHCQPRCRAYSPFASLGWQIARLESARMNFEDIFDRSDAAKRSAVRSRDRSACRPRRTKIGRRCAGSRYHHGLKPRRCMPIMLSPQRARSLPHHLAIRNGRRVRPPTFRRSLRAGPIRTNWWTAQRPPRTA